MICEDCRYSLKNIAIRGRYTSPSSGYDREEWMAWCTFKGEPVRHYCEWFERRGSEE